MKKSWVLNIRTVSEANCSEHWTVKNKRHQWQKFLIKQWWKEQKPEYSLPLTITLTRMAPRKLDKEDNLPMAFKWIKDSIADQIFPGKAAGRADDSDKLIWQFDQVSAKSYAIKIEFNFYS